jgi:spore coat protein A
MPNRRDFLKIGALAAGSALLPIKWTRSAFAQIPGGTLPPGDIPKYHTQLVIPPAMRRTSVIAGPGGRPTHYYEIAVRQFQQQILPTPLPATTVWSYGSVNHPATFNYPAFTIEARWRAPVRVKWMNQLVDANNNFRPHLLAVDPTLHWANPPGGATGRDSQPTFTETPGPYTGPVPMSVHLHGGHSSQESDGHADAWFVPNASNIPAGFATTGTEYDAFKLSSPLGGLWGPGFAVFEYDNDQRAGTMWYHDHTLGMTRLNVYAGPAGFYLLRGGPSELPAGVLPGPAPGMGSNPFGTFYEIPIAIQDRSFNSNGSLFYPNSREFFDGFTGPFIPDSDMSPIWNPEFFGNTIVVNGRTWPFLNVEQRRYRFRFLNGCNSRFLILKFDNPNVDLWQIGTEGGFLPAPVRINDLNVGGLGGVLLMGLAERADVIADFTNVPVGTEVLLLNLGPDEPFGGFPTPASDANTTGQVMQFRVVAATSVDTSTPPQSLILPKFTPLGAATHTRPVSLHEKDSETEPDVGPQAAFLGDGTNPKKWDDPITENPALNSIEVWEISNFTADAHPIHIHEVMFQVVDREPFGGGPPRPPEAWETGYKDTVIAYPDEITRVKALFDRAGLFVWHCHIVEHEDNEMMRPYQIGP